MQDKNEIYIALPTDMHGAVRIFAAHIGSADIEIIGLDTKIYSSCFDENTLSYKLSSIKEAVRSQCKRKNALTVVVTDLLVDGAGTSYDNSDRFGFISTIGLKKDERDRIVATLLALCFLECYRSEAEYCGLLKCYLSKPDETIQTLKPSDQDILSGIKNARLLNSHVFITHGIRTYGYWADQARRVFRDEYGFESTVVRYGLIKVLTFLFSKTIRDKLAVEILVNVQRIKRFQPDVRLSIVVHSYSSILIFKALEIAGRLGINLEIDALVINASILRTDVDWFKFIDASGGNKAIRIHRILNICGDSDIWPIIASKLVPDAGPSGVFFFSVDSREIQNIRLENCQHSGMLTPKHFKDLWAPFILGGNVASSNKCIPASPIIEKLDFYFWPIFLSILTTIVFLIYETTISWPRILDIPSLTIKALSNYSEIILSIFI